MPTMAFLITTGSGGDTVYANRKIAEMTGWGVDDLLKKSMRDYIAPDTFPDEIKLYSQILEGMPFLNHCEITISQKNGVAIPVEMTVSKTLWHGQPAVLTIIRDITERKKRDEEFIRACKLKSLSTLAGGIAHDFNNLLTGILGNASIAKTLANPGDKLHKIITDLENVSLRAKDLTHQLLTFAKGGAPVKKNRLYRQIAQKFSHLCLSGSNVKCDFSIAKDLWPVEVDEGQIAQVIHNLIINAKQAMPDGGNHSGVCRKFCSER